MRKIAILVSGEGLASERIVRLFNEGNRVRTEFVVVDKESASIVQQMENADVEFIIVGEQELDARSSEISKKFEDAGISLIVDDSFRYAIPEEIIEAGGRRLLKVTSAEDAPREVIGVLEADLRQTGGEQKIEIKEEPREATPEDEWAQTLKINYRPPKPPVVPPPIPSKEGEESPTQTYGEVTPMVRLEVKEPIAGNNLQRKSEEEVMPPTYLIWSILTTVFCCFIPGIVAIIFSSQVSSKFYAGDIEGARKSSRLAEIWIIVSVVLGVLTATLYLPFMLIS